MRLNLILETPRAGKLGYRLAVGGDNISENRLERLLSNAAKAAIGQDYIAVSRSVRQTGSSGAAGREAEEKLILLHDGISSAEPEKLKHIRNRMLSILENEIEKLVCDESVWKNARRQTTVRVAALDLWLKDLKALLPRGDRILGEDVQDTWAKQEPSLKITEPQEETGEKSSGFSARSSLRLILLLIVFLGALIAGIFLIYWLAMNTNDIPTPSHNSVEKFDKSKYVFLDDYDWIESPSNKKEAASFDRKLKECWKAFEAMFEGQQEKNVEEALRSWFDFGLEQYKEVAVLKGGNGNLSKRQFDAVYETYRKFAESADEDNKLENLNNWHNSLEQDGMPDLMQAVGKKQEKIIDRLHGMLGKEKKGYERFIETSIQFFAWNCSQGDSNYE